MARTVSDDIREIFGEDVTPDWKRLARYVIDRRNAMGLTQEQIAQMKGGPSTASLRAIELALQDNYRDATLMGLSKVLGWTPDSYRAVLAGREPREMFPVEDYRSQVEGAGGTVAGGVQDQPVYSRRDESALRDAVRELRRGLEQQARGIETAQRAAAAIANELDAGDDE